MKVGAFGGKNGVIPDIAKELHLESGSQFKEVLGAVDRFLGEFPKVKEIIPKNGIAINSPGGLTKLISLQSSIQNFQIKIELVSKTSESVLSITRRIQNG